jgi:protein-disulfide isomerase
MTRANSRRTRRKALLAIAAALFAASGCATQAPAPGAPAASQAGGDFRTLGRADAPVIVIEFTDLQCPYCAGFAATTFPELRRLYIDTGKVRFSARDLPLSMHPYAIPAAVAARCAGEQGKYWEYRDALFREQPQLAAAPYDQLARRFDLDAAAFTACRSDGRQERRVREEAAVAYSQGIASTPTFLIGRLVKGEFVAETLPGAQPLAVFEQKIEALLKP